MVRQSLVWRGSLLLLSVALLTPSAPLSAADWSLKFGASESLSLNDNIGLTEVNRDAALATSTSFNFDLLGKAHTYEIEFMPALGLSQKFFTEVPENWQYLPSATLAFRKFGKSTSYDLRASFARTDASSNDLLNDIVSTNEGDQLTYTLGANLTHKVNGQNSLGWVNSATLVDFSIPSVNLVPYTDVTSTGTWRQQITELVDTDLSLGVEYYDPDSVSQSAAMAIRSRVGLNARLTKRFSVNGNIGVVLWAPVDSASTLGPIFNIAAAYKLKNTSYSLSAGLDLSADQDGTLKNLFTSNFTVSHQINDMLSAGLSAGYSAQATADQPQSSVLTVTPSLHYRLSQDWTSALSYQFVQSDDAETSAHSNAVTLSLSYGTVLLP